MERLGTKSAHVLAPLPPRNETPTVEYVKL
jgi:hypothetical protein